MLKKTPLLLLLALAAVLAVTGGVQAWPGVTERVSVASDGTEGNGASDSPLTTNEPPSISDNGQFVAFQSVASNLINGDTNGFADVFVHDRETGGTARVSVSSLGTQADSVSQLPDISGDGRFVAFHSYATNLVDGVYVGGVYVHDRQTGATELTSLSSDGVPGNNNSEWPSISGDGRYVAFHSFAFNLVENDANNSCDHNGDTVATENCGDIFVHDRETGITTIISVDSGGTIGNGDSTMPAISSDGRFVAFSSTASNLVTGDTNSRGDVFVHDRQTGATSRVSVDSNGVEGNAFSFLGDISGDGRFIVFQSTANNLVTGDTNARADVFVHDRQTSVTSRISVASNGAQGNGNSGAAGIGGETITDDGRFVAFESDASNLVPGDTNGFRDVFVHDRQTGITIRVSVDAAGEEGNGKSSAPAITAGGRHVAFHSLASNLVPDDTNGVLDVFVHDLGDLDGDGEWDPFDADADGDGVPGLSEGECGDAIDNDGNGLVNDGCPVVGGFDESGAECANAIDDDGDGWINDGCPGATETLACASKALDPNRRPERTDGPFAGVDDNGDTVTDEALPAGAAAYDCDGDGFTGSAEAAITTSDQDACGNDGWPADLKSQGASLNRLDIADFNSFIFPLRGDGSFSKFNHPIPDPQDPDIARWNLKPTEASATVIDIGDLNALNPAVNAPTARPPMLGGLPAFFAVPPGKTLPGECPWPP